MKKRMLLRTVVPFTVLFFLLFTGQYLSNAENAVSFNQKGWDSYKKTEYDRAVFYFVNSIRTNPRYTDSLIGAGKSYHALGIYDKALDMFYDALRLDPNSVEALNSIGMVLSDTGRFTEAIGFFEKSYSLSGDNLDSQYGLAYVYYRMDRKVWAKRKIDNIFRSNPYHFQSLLLMADIKTDEGRLGDAREYIDKAINANSNSPVGFIKYGSILLKNYLKTGDTGSLDEARDSYGRALAINPENYEANRDMGMISLMEMETMNCEKALTGSFDQNLYNEKGNSAVGYLAKAVSINSNKSTIYSLALAYDLSGDRGRAVEYMLQAYKKYPSDSMLKAKLEDFLILNDYKSAYPARVMLSNENVELSRLNTRESLHENVIYYLRRALFLNPQNREVHEQLINYYSVLDYNVLMIDEMKNLLQQYPDYRIQDELSLAIMKRRDRLYCREGYSYTEVPRDVPRVIVLNFDSSGRITDHPDAGKTASRGITFALQQFGRLRVVGIREREALAGDLVSSGDNLFAAIKKIRDYRDSEGRGIDYIIYGDIYEVDDYLKLNCRIMDIERGYIISEFEVSGKGRENMGLGAVRAAEKIFNSVPYSGRILKLKEEGILVNLGLIDGVTDGTQLVIYLDSRSGATNDAVRSAEIFTVKETDTFLCYAVPDRPDVLKDVDSTYTVYPLQKRRARKLG